MPKLRVLIKPPPEPSGDAEQQVEALRDYLLQVSEELAYVLTHLEADNINDTTFERIQGMIPRAYTGLPPMDGQASSGQAEAWARGDHRHPSDEAKVDKTQKVNGHALSGDVTVTKGDVGLSNVANERQYSAQNPPPTPTPGDVGAVPATRRINGYALSADIDLTAGDVGAVDAAAVGAAGGVAELDSGGRVPSSQLPGYVDDVLEYPTDADFPATGEAGKIYVAEDTNVTYRWSGSAYVEISASLALGETSSTAYRGDRGKEAFDHSQTVGNPHGTTAADVGLGNVANELQYSVSNPPPVPAAADIPYDNSQSGLAATDIQAAVDELSAGGGGGGPSPSDSNPLMDGTADPGTAVTYSRSNHVHPSDDSKQDVISVAGVLLGDGIGGISAAEAGDLPYDNTQSGMQATDVQSALDELAQGSGGNTPQASVIPYDNSLSGLSATNVQDAIDEVLGEIPANIAEAPQAGSISLSGTWSGSGPYTQTVTVTGATVTASSKVDIQLTAAQIATLITAGVTAMVIENNNGTLTAYAVGAKPSAMTVQVTVTEVST